MNVAQLIDCLIKHLGYIVLYGYQTVQISESISLVFISSTIVIECVIKLCSVISNYYICRALFIMSKSGFKSPQLKDKTKW